jgi:hypothetical protein
MITSKVTMNKTLFVQKAVQELGYNIETIENASKCLKQAGKNS